MNAIQHKHFKLNIERGEVIQVTLDKQADVMLMDEANYNRYCVAKKYSFTGGRATRSPVQLVPPAAGHWHLVVSPAAGGALGVRVETVSNKPVSAKYKIRPW